MKQSRRDFVKTGAASLVGASALLHSNKLFAKNLNLPLGLQLYSVRDLLPKDYAGTLKDVGGVGYREVESAGYFNHSAAEVKQAMDAANLKLVSAHYSSNDLHTKLDEVIEFNHKLGVGHLICSFPGKDPSKPKSTSSDLAHSFTQDDWKWNADQFNQIGEKVKAAGMGFAYHNHVAEFTAIDGALPWEVLEKNTDPAKVSFEMDCGWVIVAGQNPVPFLKKYPRRIVMLHIKDFKAMKPPSVALGAGDVDYKPIFAAAKHARIRHVFVEQEESVGPMLDALAIDAKYMAQFK